MGEFVGEDGVQFGVGKLIDERRRDEQRPLAGPARGVAVRRRRVDDGHVGGRHVHRLGQPPDPLAELCRRSFALDGGEPLSGGLRLGRLRQVRPAGGLAQCDPIPEQELEGQHERRSGQHHGPERDEMESPDPEGRTGREAKHRKQAVGDVGQDVRREDGDHVESDQAEQEGSQPQAEGGVGGWHYRSYFDTLYKKPDEVRGTGRLSAGASTYELRPARCRPG